MINKNYLSKNFNNAARDYFYLLEKEYPQKATLKLIGDKYKLTGLERSVLQRGIIKKEIAGKRKKKLLKDIDIKGMTIIIDCYNILITICSYLNGKFLYISNDGFLRDAAESHGKIKKPETIIRALILMFKYLSENKVKKIEIYLDSPVSYSKELSKKISLLFIEYNIAGNNYVVKSADYHLIQSREGICSTSDSIIIDHKNKVFDLSYYILKRNFNPDFILLDNFIK